MVARLLLTWLLMLAVPAFAAPGFVMTTNQLVVGESSTFELQVTGGKPLSVPRVEHSDGVEIEYLGSSPVTIRQGGRLLQMYRFQFKMTALEPGEHAIGPATVEYADGHDEQSIVHTLTVGTDKDALLSNFEADVAYMPEEAWEGQVVLYRYRLRSRARPSRTRWIEPEHQGLVAPRDGDRPRREYAVEDAEGMIWIDETYIPYIITGTGDLSLQSAILQVWWTVERVDPIGLFDRTRNETYHLGPAPLTAKALPPAPDAFSGLVGDFVLRGSFDKRAIKVGESATWELSLMGNGALDGFAFPKPEGKGFRVYDGTLASDAAVRDGKYIAKNVAQLSVVATKAGKVRIPPMEIVVFSPSKGDYVTLRAEGTTLEVAPGAGGETEVESFAPDVDETIAEAAEAPDIRGPWARGLATTVWLGPGLPWMLMLAGAPGVGALGLIAGRRVKRWSEARAKPREVVIDPEARLRHLPEDRHHRLAEIDAALREALALHRGVEVAALDRGTALSELDGELAEQARAAAAALDRARFADGPSEGLAERVSVVVSRLLKEAA
ncbi:MAG: hypothetical protein EP330_02795 [Deltaproteobacteria bacterium]|nr:MAG: hypothetical protein EP330_02795 [Deltaproteobacteria bacterium]